MKTDCISGLSVMAVAIFKFKYTNEQKILAKVCLIVLAIYVKLK